MSQQCSLDGNPDLYGLGIRLGIYLSWAASQVATLFELKDVVNGLRDSYLVFNLAVMTALFVSTWTSELHVIEVVVMLFLCAGGMLGIVDANSDQYPSLIEQTKDRTWRMMTYWFTETVANSYAIWFYTNGKSSQFMLQNECGTVTFLFAKIPAASFDRISYVFLAFHLLVAVYEVIGVSVILPSLFIKHKAAHRRKEGAQKAAVDCEQVVLRRGSSEKGLVLQQHDDDSSLSSHTIKDEQFSHNPEIPKWLLMLDRLWTKMTCSSPIDNISSAITGSLLTAYCILGIELMLWWNHITDVNTVRSVGQLIPLVIGLGGFVKVVLDVHHERKGKLATANPVTHNSDKMSSGIDTRAFVPGAVQCMQSKDGKWQ